MREAGGRCREWAIATAVAVLGLAGVCLAPAACAAPAPSGWAHNSFDRAVDQLVRRGYPQAIERRLCAFGTSPLGFRNAGSASDDAAAAFLRDEMIAAGLADVRLEPVPVDETQFNGASITAEGRVMLAVPWGGCPGTDLQGIEAEVVYVHSATSAEMDAVGDVTGKICLVDYDTDDYHPSIQAAQCAGRGAVAMILTRAEGVTEGMYGAPGALGENDGCWDLDWGPMLFVAQEDGDWLKGRLADGPLTVTFRSDVSVRTAADGGLGYNVAGVIRGRRSTGQSVVVTAHHDAYFSGGLDDSSAVAGMLLLARAMKASGYRPDRTIVFMATTGEECGQTDAFYDWLYGAAYSVIKEHPGWSGSVVGNVNLEMLGFRDDPELWSVNSVELDGWYAAAARRHRALSGAVHVLDSLGAETAQSDSYAFMLAGIPAVSLQTPWQLDYYERQYHTQYDTADLVDYRYLGRNVKFIERLVARLADVDRLLPYDLRARGRQIARVFDRKALRRAGASSSAVSSLSRALVAYSHASAAFQRRRSRIAASHYATVNAGLLRIVGQMHRSLLALDQWEEAVYPHTQVYRDLASLNAAIRLLGLPEPDSEGALEALEAVGMSWYGTHFDYSAYLAERRRHLPSYAKLGWGARAHLAPNLDVMPQYRLVKEGRCAQARRELLSIAQAQAAELDARLLNTARVLRSAASAVRRLR